MGHWELRINSYKLLWLISNLKCNTFLIGCHVVAPKNSLLASFLVFCFYNFFIFNHLKSSGYKRSKKTLYFFKVDIRDRKHFIKYRDIHYNIG